MAGDNKMRSTLKPLNIIVIAVILIGFLLATSYCIYYAKKNLKDPSDGTSVPDSTESFNDSDEQPANEDNQKSETVEEAGNMELSDYRPMVYVEDTLYLETDFIHSLPEPEGADIIGNIENVISQTERPDENFTSNNTSASIGSPIYAYGDDLSVIYVEENLTMEDGSKGILYAVYMTEAKLQSNLYDY